MSRTLSGLNELSVDVLNIRSSKNSLKIEGHSGFAGQYVRKNDLTNKLEYHDKSSDDGLLAGTGISYNGATKKFDLNLGDGNIYGTEVMTTLTDTIPFIKSTDNTTNNTTADTMVLSSLKNTLLPVEIDNGGIQVNETDDNGNSIITTANNVLRGHINYIEGRMEFKTADGRRVIYSKANSGNNDLELGNFSTDVSDIKVELKNDLYPTSDLTFDLGKTAKQFNNLFCHNIVCDKLIPVLPHGEYALAIQIDDFLPTADNTKSIGDYNLRYMDSFVNTTYTNNIETIGSASEINLGNDIIPNINAQHDLGSSTKTFNHIYASIFTGNLNGSATNATTSASCIGNSATATALETARSIGGVSFNGTADIILPGVNTGGTQNTSGNASTSTNCLGVSATANALHTARHLGGVLFDGTADISLPGVNIAGTQDTAGNAATATNSATADGLTISFDADIDGSGFDLTQIKDLTITSIGLATGVGTEITLKATILPDTDNSYNLGSSLKRFDDIYAETFNGGLVGNATTSTTATNLTGSFTDNIDGGDNNLTNVDTIETTTITPFLANGTGITLDKNPYRSVNELYIKNLPTSITGLSAGRIWNNGGTLSII